MLTIYVWDSVNEVTTLNITFKRLELTDTDSDTDIGGRLGG
jgi:hypothetical protein